VTVLAAAVGHTSNDTQLIIAALLGIATVVVLITWLKVHPFLALIFGSAVLGLVAGVSPTDIITSFSTGVGSTVGSVGLLIALGAMIGGLLTASGGADRIVTAIVDRVGPRALPWAMGGVAALIGIPLFFEVGVVLLIPIVLLVARRSRQPVLRVGIPALAGLSVLHGFVPPHPGPLVAISTLGASLSLVLIFGLIIAVPTVILAGPVFGTWSAAGCTSRIRTKPWSGRPRPPPPGPPARPAARPTLPRRVPPARGRRPAAAPISVSPARAMPTAPGTAWPGRGRPATGHGVSRP
jgi:gluconate:H+ symporter, GntP family